MLGFGLHLPDYLLLTSSHTYAQLWLKYFPRIDSHLPIILPSIIGLPGTPFFSFYL